MNAVTVYNSVRASNPNDQIMQHAPLVKRIAYHLLNKLPDSVQVDDLIQAGMLGLLEAIKHFDVSHGASFDTYAGIRIRGAMLDEVRRNDWSSHFHSGSRFLLTVGGCMTEPSGKNHVWSWSRQNRSPAFYLVVYS